MLINYGNEYMNQLLSSTSEDCKGVFSKSKRRFETLNAEHSCHFYHSVLEMGQVLVLKLISPELILCFDSYLQNKLSILAFCIQRESTIVHPGLVSDDTYISTKFMIFIC